MSAQAIINWLAGGGTKVQLSGSIPAGTNNIGDVDVLTLPALNFEQTLNATLPTKANLIGISDGSKIQAMQGNTEGVLLTSSARTTTSVSPDQNNVNARGVLVTLYISTAGTGTLKTKIQGKIFGISQYVALNADPTGITASGTYSYELYPGASSAGVAGTLNVQQRTAGALPKTFRAAIYHSDASEWTYSVSYSLLY